MGYSDPALILPGAVGSTELADNAVTTAKLNDGAVTNVKVNTAAAIVASKLSGVPFTTSSNVTGSRAINTIYQNAGSGPIFCVVTVTSTSTVSVYAKSDENATPIATVYQGQTENEGDVITVPFWVLSGHYYQIPTFTGGSIVHWEEYS